MPERPTPARVLRHISPFPWRGDCRGPAVDAFRARGAPLEERLTDRFISEARSLAGDDYARSRQDLTRRFSRNQGRRGRQDAAITAWWTVGKGHESMPWKVAAGSGHHGLPTAGLGRGQR